MQGKRVNILFEGVDYSCEVWLNGHYLGSHEGMYSSFQFEIAKFLHFEEWYEGRNLLAVKLDPPPRNYRKVGGRKFCFAGDYMPDVVPFGIWQGVKVFATGDVQIEKTRIESQLENEDALVTMEVIFNNLTDAPTSLTLQAEMQGKNFSSSLLSVQQEVQAKPGLSTVLLTVPVKQAKLWWPWDMGEQHLYEVKFSLSREGEALDTYQETFGIREIKMAMNPGFTAEEVENPWTFMINGKRHFLRSACWGGPPSMLYGRNSPEKYRRRLELVKEANINNLRIFGWHPPEIHLFYELCDQLGITVWTNFSFATQAFEATPEFMRGALNECVSIVEQRRNHPSNIFGWVGKRSSSLTRTFRVIISSLWKKLARLFVK